MKTEKSHLPTICYGQAQVIPTSCEKEYVSETQTTISRDMRNIMASLPGCKVEKYGEEYNYIEVSYAKEFKLNLAHITGFITSYQR
jgi:arginine repressor